jgi:hypothetical protein
MPAEPTKNAKRTRNAQRQEGRESDGRERRRTRQRVGKVSAATQKLAQRRAKEEKSKKIYPPVERLTRGTRPAQSNATITISEQKLCMPQIEGEALPLGQGK